VVSEDRKEAEEVSELSKSRVGYTKTSIWEEKKN
jgi:hypothetical protein